MSADVPANVPGRVDELEAMRLLGALHDYAEPSALVGYFGIPSRRSSFEAPGVVPELSCAEDCFFTIGLFEKQPARGRGSEQDVVALPAIHVDIDLAGGAHKATNLPTLDRVPRLLQAFPLRPSAIVFTGGGFHVYWIFKEPLALRTPDERARARSMVARVQGVIRAAAAGVHVDATDDLVRLLRVPGTTNHKYDPPRLVEIHELNEHRYTDDEVEEALSRSIAPVAASSQVESDPAFAGRNNHLKAVLAAMLDRGESLERVVFELLRVDSEQHVPPLFSDPSEHRSGFDDPYTNALRFVASNVESINRRRLQFGEPPQRFAFASVDHHLPGASANDSGEPEVDAFPIGDWTADRYVGPAPDRPWLVEGVFPMGAVSILAAQGDTGKGMALLDLAFKVAQHEDDTTMVLPRAFGGPVVAHGSAVIFAAEDCADDIHYRLAKLDQYGQRTQLGKRLFIVPLPDAGGNLALVERGRGGPQATESYHRIKRALDALEDLRLVVFDPLSSFCHLDVNADPIAGAFVTGLLASLATETKAAVIVAHHMRKVSDDSPIRSLEGARAAIRGTSALVDGVRCAYALWPSPEDQARKVCRAMEREFARNIVFRGGVVKANRKSNRHVHTYLRHEDTGLLEDWTLEAAACLDEVEEDDADTRPKRRTARTDVGTKSAQRAREARLSETSTAMPPAPPAEKLDHRHRALWLGVHIAEVAGKPMSKRGPENGLYARRGELDKCLADLGEKTLRTLVDDLLEAGHLVIDKRTLRVVKKGQDL